MQKRIISLAAMCAILTVPSMGTAAQAAPLYEQEVPTKQLKKLHIPTAWANGYAGKGVRVAVIDTGVNKNSKLLSNVKERYSFTTDNPYTKHINEGDVLDRVEAGHGTGVAGVIGAKPLMKNEDFSIFSVAPKVTIASYKYKDGTEDGDVKELTEAITQAIDDGADIISISSGLQSDIPSLHRAIKRAVAQNIVVVASAGNNNTKNVTYPARYDEVIAVTSISSKNKRSTFANYGKGIDFVAPGENIPTIAVNGELYEASGTSFATPFITGMLALLKQQYPYSTPQQLKEKLIASSKDLGVKGYDTTFGYGMPRYTYVEKEASILPASYEVTAVTDHSATLKFAKTADDTWDSIIISLHGNEIARTSKSSYTLKNLTADEVQLISIRALNANGDASKSQEFTFVTQKDSTPPTQAKNIQFRLATNQKARISWDATDIPDYAYAKIYINGQYVGKSTSSSFTTKKLALKKAYKASVVLYDTSGLASTKVTAKLATY
ncbi:S8 family peptidase [Kurthia huakuii]|uniref:S8 family peptidase n=1 Tax=Kurthia huakuii TaxID=1421019 RepID=UPI0004982418|nr:S8 family serine peptidase [Kurthia huakuii]MBM7698227.1 minor extracellular protease Epr [Kurthia huakuii]